MLAGVGRGGGGGGMWWKPPPGGWTPPPPGGRTPPPPGGGRKPPPGGGRKSPAGGGRKPPRPGGAQARAASVSRAAVDRAQRQRSLFIGRTPERGRESGLGATRIWRSKVREARLGRARHGSAQNNRTPHRKQ